MSKLIIKYLKLSILNNLYYLYTNDPWPRDIVNKLAKRNGLVDFN